MDHQSEYIQMLKTEFHNRKSANQSYSLRAFARDLELAAPRLSMAFTKSKGFSPNAAEGITLKLNWSEGDKKLFINLVRAVHARSKKSRALAALEIKQNIKENKKSIEKFIEDDDFKQIAEPIHYQIIEALKLNNIIPTIEGISNVLNYPNDDIKNATERLISLNLISVDNNNNLSVSEYKLQTSEKNPSMALRQHHSLQISAALNAISEQDIKTRTLSSLTIAVPKEIIPEIFEKITKFREEINELISNHENQDKTDIYCLSTQFFKLSKELK